MHPDALSRLRALAGIPEGGDVLSASADGRVVLAAGDVVAKLGAPGEAVRAEVLAGSLAEALGRASPLVVPRILWRRGDAVGMERLTGASYRDLASGRGAEEALARAGRAVAALHALPAAAPLVARGLGDHVGDLIRPHPDALAGAVPREAARIRAVLAAVASRAEPPGPDGPRVVHRDLHLGQMFAAPGGRVAIVDWDLAALGDPALDLGNLRAYLATRVPDRAAALWAAFAAAHGGAALARHAAYEALAYLRMGAKAVRLGGPAGAEDLGRLLGRAEEALSR